MTFTESTAYVSEWRWQNSVEDYTYQGVGETLPLKVAWDDLTKPDITGLAGGLSLTDEYKVGTVWNPTQDATYRTANSIPAAVTFNPQHGDKLSNENGGWIVERVIESRFGRWTLAVNPERENVPA